MDLNVSHQNGTLLASGGMREEVARKAIALRKAGSSIDDISVEFKVGRASLALLVDVVTLADRDDLPERDAKLARDALEAVNKGARLTDVRKMIDPVIVRVWGSSTRRGGHRDKTENRRREQFEQAIAVALRACANTTQLEPVHLPPERAIMLAKELTLAMRQLHITRANLEGMK